jgi:bacillolysin
MFNKNKYQKILAILVVLNIMLTGLHPAHASAQSSDGISRQVNSGTGRVSFIGPETGRVLSASQALGNSAQLHDPALTLVIRFAPEFGLRNPEQDLVEMKKDISEDGRISVRYQQNYQGIPVMGGGLIVNTNGKGDLYSINGEVSSNISLQTRPTVDSAQAAENALQAVAKWYQVDPAELDASEPELWIYDASLLQPDTRSLELVWRMEVMPKDAGMPMRELVLVNAQRGNISLHFNQIDAAWHTSAEIKKPGVHAPPGEDVKTVMGSPLISTYTANNGTSLPGAFLCDQSANPCTGGSNPDADAAHKYALGTYTMYANTHSRDSINNAGMAIKSTVHYNVSYANAFWDGSQMIYGDAYGFAQADDVVAHELTHGVTQYESNLFYYYQSGAINESFSDVWGEFYDQTNGDGNDTAGVNWLVGEDVSGLGAIRSMNNPPAYGDPDKMSNANYYMGDGDSGGVHYNSGINNKAVYLMVDGGSFNGKTVTALGWTKTIAIYYEVQKHLLTSGADYSDLYYALQQACKNLTGQKGITSVDCTEVKEAVDAVEMNEQPAANFNPDAPLCEVGQPSIEFADDLETGTANWTFTNGGNSRWGYDSPWGAYAQSGSHFLYADDYQTASVGDESARLISVAIPANAYLHFAHAYDFEHYAPNVDPNFYDGGVIEYSLNNGLTWVDAGSLIDSNGYNGIIFNGYGNPLAARNAFVGVSHGYISTRLNLASLAGHIVSFRWRMGLDSYGYSWGWWLDNIRIYTCHIFADVPTSYWSWDYIERLYSSGITGGCIAAPLQYCPDATVTRAQMSVFLLRGIHGSSYTPPPLGTTSGFNDVPTNYWAAAWIKQLAAEGITGGCGNNNYCPEAPVTRAQMAVFLLRAEHGGLYNPPPVGVTSGFNDVPTNYWAAAWIKQLVTEGITSGCGNSNYCPESPVTRAQMAVFLVRTFNLP